jgi:hypothetical protein
MAVHRNGLALGVADMREVLAAEFLLHRVEQARRNSCRGAGSCTGLEERAARGEWHLH